MHWSESRVVYLGLTGVVLLLLVNASISAWNTRRLVQNESRVTHTLEVLETLNDVQATVAEAEAAQRGFLITGSPRYLTPFQTTSNEVEDLLHRLKALVADNPEQRERAAALETLVQMRFDRLQRTLSIRNERGVEAANSRVGTDDGQQITENIHAQSETMKAEEGALLVQRSSESDHSLRVKVVTNLLGTLIGIGAVSVAFLLFHRRLRERERTESRARQQAVRETAIGEIRQQALSEASLDEILDRAVQLIAAAVDVPLVGIMQLVPAKEHLLLRSGAGWEEGNVGKATVSAAGDSQAGLVPRVDPLGTQVLQDHGVVDGWSEVIRDWPNQPFGILGAYTTRPRTFSDDDTRFLRVAASVLGSAVQRRRAEEALRESEARFRALVDSVPGIVWTSLPNGDCDYVNQRWLDFTGSTFEQTQGMRWVSALHHEDVESSTQRWKRSMETGEPFECEYRFRTKKGDYRWCLGRAVPVRNAEGRIVKWFGTCTDIEDYKRLEAALREAHRHKDQFLAMLGHELRNPLAPIVNVLELLKRRARQDPGLAWEVDAIDRQVADLTRLVDDLLDASRIGRGKLRIERAVIDLREAVLRAVELARPLIDARRHKLKVELPSETLRLHADRTRLVQVIGNLLSNAAKYTDPGGQIWLQVERQGEEVVVQVRDDGVGIPAEMLPHVFEMFLQVDESTSRSQGGLGIGLALVRKLVELHGGSVEARSEGPGRGSEFFIRLPLDGLDLARPVTAEEVGHAAPAIRPCRILVVDDNRLLAESFARLLRDEGCDVRTAGEGKAALALARDFHPEVLFLDLGLPDMDGYELARCLRLEPALKEALLVAVTGYSQPADAQRGRSAGFEHHLIKPVQMEKVERVIREFQMRKS
jgi:PAS domain S-box-containing protein